MQADRFDLLLLLVSYRNDEVDGSSQVNHDPIMGGGLGEGQVSSKVA